VRKWAAAALAAAFAAPAAFAQSLDESGFRYVRPLQAPAGLAAFEPDGVLFAHTERDLADLRILDSAGRQVPWRLRPLEASTRPPLPVLVLNSGTQEGAAVALLDLGPNAGIHDQVTLDIPERDFVGNVQVSGSDRRQGRFTRLSTTGIYDISGAPPARSTTAVYPPSDFRYLSLRATGVREIAGASVIASRGPQPELLEREPRDVSVRSNARLTIMTVDLGFRNMPVDEIRVLSSSKLYDRPVQVEASNTGERYVLYAQGRVFRFDESVEATIPLEGRHRYLRLTIENGDDAPLEGLSVEALARPRTVFVSEGFAPPYQLLYGNPRLGAPEYDFAQAEIDPDTAAAATLGREALNPAWEAPEDTRSFTARHPQVIKASLALAAAVLLFGAFLALRGRTGSPSGG
jgi:hypothetical protein